MEKKPFAKRLARGFVCCSAGLFGSPRTWDGKLGGSFEPWTRKGMLRAHACLAVESSSHVFGNNLRDDQTSSTRAHLCDRGSASSTPQLPAGMADRDQEYPERPFGQFSTTTILKGISRFVHVSVRNCVAAHRVLRLWENRGAHLRRPRRSRHPCLRTW